MTAFKSRWADWEPSNSTEGRADAGNGGVHGTAPPTSEAPIHRTDKTDNSASEGEAGQIVSFVSATPNRIVPETRCDNEHDSSRDQARLNDGNSPIGWDTETAAAIEWFLTSEPPAEPFVLRWCERGIRPAVEITNPKAFWRSLMVDVNWGPAGPRARYGALQDDLRRLHDLFGGGGSA